MNDGSHDMRPAGAAGCVANPASWYEASARQRVDGLLDAGSFEEFLGPRARVASPHLPLFGLPQQFDDGMIVGRGRLDGKPVLVAAQEGRFMGGAFGEVHGAKLTGLLRAVRELSSVPVLILFDTGGVRLQEANAGELAVAEIMRALIDARADGVPVVGLIGGRAGCYGGGGLLAACCSALVVSEQGRIGVSGPEVIETNRGVEEFDAKDRALIWRTMGGKHRRLIGAAQRFVEDTPEAFRGAAIALIDRAPAFDAGMLRASQTRLDARLVRFGACGDGRDVWRALGAPDPDAIPGMFDDAFIALADQLQEAVETSPALAGSQGNGRPAWSASEGGSTTLDAVLSSLFPHGHAIERDGSLLYGHADVDGTRVDVIGVADRLPFGVDEAARLASQVLATIERGDATPILVLVDSDSQRMSKRDELLGLNEYLSHLAKCLMQADIVGHRTIGMLYGHTAAGAFIATALATRTLLALPGAEPEVMDLPSMSRVTKLPLDVLKEKARTTAVFAPGLNNLVEMGAVDAVLDPVRPLDGQFAEWLAKPSDRVDRRAARGRPVAADVAQRVYELARAAH